MDVMDMVQDWAGYLMSTHIGIAPYVRQALSAASTLKSYLVPLIDQVSSKPDLATVALLIIIIFVSLKILNMLYNTVMFWVRMISKFVLWGSFAALVLWIYTRGPEGVADDAQYWWRTWNSEYEHWKDQERVARMMNQQMGGAPRQRNW